MPPIPTLKPNQVQKILLKNDFVIKRQTRSHRVYFNAKTGATVIVPFHSRDIPKGTLGSIIKQSKLSMDQFLK